MSTLKTHNLQSPDSGSANIALAQNAGMVVAGISTFTSNVIANSKVGIGTDNPAADLHISSGANTEIRIEDTTTTPSYGRIIYNNNADSADALVFEVDVGNVISDSNIRFKVDGSEKLRIDSSGRLLLGTTSVGSASTYYDNLIISNTTSGEGSGITFFANATNGFSAVDFADTAGVGRGRITYSHGNDDLRIDTAGSERLRIESDGDFRLSSGEAGTNYGWIRGWETGTGNLIFSGDHSATGTNGSSIIFKTRGDEKLRILHEGKVGIGTTNPDGELEIYNDSSSTATKLRITALNSSAHLYLAAQGTNKNSIIYFTDSSGSGYDGLLRYSHSSNTNFSGLAHAYNGSAHVAFRISKSGGFEFGDTGNLLANSGNYGTAGQVLRSNGNSPPSWSGGAQRVLEVVASPCDGSTISTSNGDVTFQNVTAQQNLSTSYADVNGSSITYQPPSGTTQVIYEFNMQVTNHDDAISIAHLRFYLDGTEVVYHRRNASGEDIDDFVNFKYIINIGGTANTNTGRIASWSNAKEMKMTAREYHSSNNAISLHTTDHWNGSSTNQFSQPVLQITAIGV